jgi:hypothetical protein
MSVLAWLVFGGVSGGIVWLIGRRQKPPVDNLVVPAAYVSVLITIAVHIAWGFYDGFARVLALALVTVPAVWLPTFFGGLVANFMWRRRVAKKVPAA